MGKNVVFSKMEGTNDVLFGKFEHPIRALIENESNICEKQKGILEFLYNVEKSNRYSETVVGQDDFDTFQSAKEGQGAENDSISPTFSKTISHIPFMKEFTVTREMADDSQFGIGANIKNLPKNFVRAYYKTRNKIAAWALINGTSTSGTFNKATVDLSTGDKLALFHKAHTYASRSGTQSNYYVNGTASSMLTSATIENTLNTLANKMRNIKDENGEAMGYIADVVIIPCNRPGLEAVVKKCIGSERAVGSNNNDINTQYGNWTLVVLPGWEVSSDKIMIMSSEANKNLLGNMFYNRISLDVKSWVDGHTRNYIWNGYCRFGVGFNTWKHIMLFDDASSNGSATTI